FELEVPEIYEGIVEIKAVSREAGDRSKIAVYSKDDKVDPVGACVGMRGQRVKNIVRELGGEKIDIVRWSINMGEFIAASLSPAEITSVKTVEADKRAEVMVADDQLSLAIGKKGQNVRLAAKLTGWNIDIRSKSEIDEVREISVIEIDGIGPKTEKALKKAGYETVGKIVKLDLNELIAVKGIGKKTAEKILKSAKELMEHKVHEVRDRKNKENREARAEKERVAAEAGAAAAEAAKKEEKKEEEETEEKEKET
ncbi:MAG: helix-hairpin-helix domain-containing protein, partial [Candidatus Omnitrophota bacterium]|nr:helix-hairpin-helix domain-containing protein [Candidatus Omnitrophota bacterium]